MTRLPKVKSRRHPQARAVVTCACGATFNRATCPRCDAPHPEGARAERKKPRHFEDEHQEKLFKELASLSAYHRDLGKVYHVPNGGARNEREGARLKVQGVRKGQLDLSLDVARGGYFGLRIELKATKEELGRQPEVSPEQRRILDELTLDGYLAVVCYGWAEAIKVLLEYVVKPRTQVQR